MNPRTFVLLLILAPVCFGCKSTARKPEQSTIDAIRTIERQRLHALVVGDIVTAKKLHADDFQLISPDGSVFTKELYLSEIASGKLHYKVWEPGEITVRLYHDVAVIRYQDTKWELSYEGEEVSPKVGWHTNLYERRHGHWQIVWSQASR